MATMTYQEAADHIRGMAGRSRVRVLDEEDLLQAIYEARTGPYGLRAGATVANSYSYPAHRMRLVVVRHKASGDYLALADWARANRGASDCPLGGRRSVWERALAEVAAAPEVPETWWRIPAASVRRDLAKRRRRARAWAEATWPANEAPADLLVTRADSLRAGNCQRETDRVASWWKRDAVPAAELRAAILKREPALAMFARRAALAARLAQQA